ncbi:MAG: hypothetical protein ACK559_28625, partial [bacterium]
LIAVSRIFEFELRLVAARNALILELILVIVLLRFPPLTHYALAACLNFLSQPLFGVWPPYQLVEDENGSLDKTFSEY